MSSKECSLCGRQHKNREGAGDIKDECANCSSMIETLNLCVKAINQYQASKSNTKKSRKLKVSYWIEYE